MSSIISVLNKTSMASLLLPQKTDSSDPKWFMVDVIFSSRAKHFIPLALFRHIAGLSPSELPDEIGYVSENGVKAIKGLICDLSILYFALKWIVCLEMALVNSGRLSVQPVSEDAWAVIVMMAEKGGWDEINFAKSKPKTTKDKASKQRTTGRGRKKDQGDEDVEDVIATDTGSSETILTRKRKAVDPGANGNDRRRSIRARK